MTSETDTQPRIPASGSGEFLPGYLLFLMASVSAAASEEFHAVVRQNGLRVPEWRVLACLHDRDGMMITRLADFCLCEQSRMTRIIDQMDKRGLVLREPDPEDRRRVRVFLTGAGREVSDKLVEEARHHEARLLSAFEDSDAARIKPVLRALLQKLAEEMQA